MPITFSFGDGPPRPASFQTGALARRRQAAGVAELQRRAAQPKRGRKATREPMRPATMVRRPTRMRQQEFRDLQICARRLATAMMGPLPAWSQRMYNDIYNLALQELCWGFNDPRIKWI